LGDDRAGQPIPKSKAADHVARSTVVQVTNLGSRSRTVRNRRCSRHAVDNRAGAGCARVAAQPREQGAVARQTNRDGIALAPRLGLRKADGHSEDEGMRVRGPGFSLSATAEKDGDIATWRPTGRKGSSLGLRLNYDLWQATDMLRGSIFTDRRLYRPGEQVHFKAIVRADTPTGSFACCRRGRCSTSACATAAIDCWTVLDQVNKWSGVDWTWMSSRTDPSAAIR
jgi:hypothetical protein